MCTPERVEARRDRARGLDDGRARFTPHAAVHPPDEDPSAPPRESVELRAFLVFNSV